MKKRTRILVALFWIFSVASLVIVERTGVKAAVPNMIMVYSKATTDTGHYSRTWNGTAWSGETTMVTNSLDSRSQVVKCARFKEECIALTSTGDPLYAQVWDGSTWSATTTLEQIIVGFYRPLDVAYESASGAAIFAWANLTDSTTIYYKRWDGSSFTASSTVSVSTMSGEGHWVRLVANPYSATNTMILGIQDAAASPDLHAVFWTGSAWVLGNGGDIDISRENDLDMNFDISFLNATTS